MIRNGCWALLVGLTFLMGPEAFAYDLKTVDDDKGALAEGKTQYDILISETRMPRYGTCWKRALQELETGCQALTEDVQSRLALSFSNCFLRKSGQPTYPCPPDTDISTCLASVDTNAFTAYSNFFTHTHNMCRFLQAQVWHESTQDTIRNLSATSAGVAAALEDSQRLQGKILAGQEAALDMQKQLARNGDLLGKALDASRTGARQLMEEFRSSTDEQRALIFSVFDRVSRLQNLVVSEVSWFYTVVFYSGCLFLVYVMTSARQTSDARVPLFILLSANVLLERIICAWSLSASSYFIEFTPFNGSEAFPEEISYRVWMVRKVSLALAALVLGYYFSTFKDYNVINHVLLQDIQRQNVELRKALDLLQGGGARLPSKEARLGFLDSVDNKAAIDSEDEVEDGDSSSVSSNLSFDSTCSDRTWLIPAGNDDELDSISLANDLSDDEARSEISGFSWASFVSATPSKKSQDESMVENVSSLGRGGGSRRGSKSKTPSRAGTPGAVKGSSSSRSSSRLSHSFQKLPHQYNLRNRSTLNHPYAGSGDSFYRENSLLETESPDSFGKYVAKMAKVAHNHSKELRQAIGARILRQNQQEQQQLKVESASKLSAFSDAEPDSYND